MQKKTRLQRRKITFRVFGIIYLALTFLAIGFVEQATALAFLIFILSMPFFGVVYLIIRQEAKEALTKPL